MASCERAWTASANPDPNFLFSMNINTCIYAPNEELKKDAAILAKLHGKSFSKFVWDLMQKMVEDQREKIENYKELTEGIKC